MMAQVFCIFERTNETLCRCVLCAGFGCTCTEIMINNEALKMHKLYPKKKIKSNNTVYILMIFFLSYSLLMWLSCTVFGWCHGSAKRKITFWDFARFPRCLCIVLLGAIHALIFFNRVCWFSALNLHSGLCYDFLESVCCSYLLCMTMLECMHFALTRCWINRSKQTLWLWCNITIHQHNAHRLLIVFSNQFRTRITLSINPSLQVECTRQRQDTPS